LALAYAAGKGDEKTRREALAALPKVARIGTHLFHFTDYVQEFRGWGRGLRTAVQEWYKTQTPERLADQVTKYQQRDGVSHRDLLRLCHVELSDEQEAIIRWAIGKDSGERTVVKGYGEDWKKNLVEFKFPKTGEPPKRIEGHIKLQTAKSGTEAAKLIRDYGLVRESVPSEFLKDKEVWEALLEKMPMTAMIRNLGNLSKCGLLAPMSEASKKVAETLGNTEAMKKARVHPIQILVAQKTYESGRGVRSQGEGWTPVPQVVDALDKAYYDAFKNVEPTGKRFYLGMDISGSMYSGVVAGITGFHPAMASGAMAMVTVKTEADYYAAGFTTGRSGMYGGQWDNGGTIMEPISLSPRQRLDTVVQKMRDLSAKMGGTDCALPMLDAMEKKLKVDVFIVYTDSETWAGKIHPSQALEKYRQKMGIPAKLVVMAMVPNGFSIADPNDGGMLDIVGFDTNTPEIIADFAKE